jgi:hypothetical protein
MVASITTIQTEPPASVLKHSLFIHGIDLFAPCQSYNMQLMQVET